MMRKDHDLPALGEPRQRAQDVCRAFIVRGDEHVIESERGMAVHSNRGMSLNGVIPSFCSGGCFRSIKDSFEENCTGIVQTLRGVIITHCGGLRIELFEGDSGLKELFSIVH